MFGFYLDGLGNSSKSSFLHLKKATATKFSDQEGVYLDDLYKNKDVAALHLYSQKYV